MLSVCCILVVLEGVFICLFVSQIGPLIFDRVQVAKEGCIGFLAGVDDLLALPQSFLLYLGQQL